MTDKGGKDASDAFRCKLIMSLKTISNNNTSIAGNVIITEEAVPKKKTDEGTYRELYIKYLYGIESLNIEDIKNYWSEGRLAFELDKLIDDFGESLLSFYGEVARDKFWKPLVWGLMYQVSGQVPAGLSVGGNTVLSVKSAKDNFGMFRINRERFNKSKAELIEADILAPLHLIEDEPLELKNLNHSHLINPSVAIQFFIRDFYHYIINVSQLKITEGVYFSAEIGLMDTSFSEEDQKIITGYFTDNKDRIELIFPFDFSDPQNPPQPIFPRMTVTPFEDALFDGQGSQGSSPFIKYPEDAETFQDWLTINMIADPGDMKFTDSIPEPPPNPQGPEPEKTTINA